MVGGDTCGNVGGDDIVNAVEDDGDRSCVDVLEDDGDDDVVAMGMGLSRDTDVMLVVDVAM